MKQNQRNQRSIVSSLLTALLFAGCAPMAMGSDAAVDDRPNPTGDTPAVSTDTPTPDGGGGGVTFAMAHAVFAAKCGDCHTGLRSGMHSIGGANQDMAFADSQLMSSFVPGSSKGAASLARILDGTMPQFGNCLAMPMGPACLTPAQIAIVRAWVMGGQLR